MGLFNDHVTNGIEDFFDFNRDGYLDGGERGMMAMYFEKMFDNNTGDEENEDLDLETDELEVDELETDEFEDEDEDPGYDEDDDEDGDDGFDS